MWDSTNMLLASKHMRVTKEWCNMDGQFSFTWGGWWKYLPISTVYAVEQASSFGGIGLDWVLYS